MNAVYQIINTAENEYGMIKLPLGGWGGEEGNWYNYLADNKFYTQKNPQFQHKLKKIRKIHVKDA